MSIENERKQNGGVQNVAHDSKIPSEAPKMQQIAIEENHKTGNGEAKDSSNKMGKIQNMASNGNYKEEKKMRTTEGLIPIDLKEKFKVNEKKFYGDKSEISVSSKGSVFQENIQEFFSGENLDKARTNIEIPSKNIDENYLKPKSLFQKMKQTNFNNDPKYGKSEHNFYNISDNSEKPKMSYAEKLDKFISNI